MRRKGRRISIHSLRVEGDCEKTVDGMGRCHFNPLPPCGGRRTASFQSLFSAGISIHSLRVEGDVKRRPMRQLQSISIHSLRVEGDSLLWSMSCYQSRFQSTPSVWRETIGNGSSGGGGGDFNPLPPCGGRLVGIRSFPDALIFQSTPSVWRETFAFAMSSDALKHFNPLPPCGGRPTPFRSRMTFLLLFQSTPSVWRETHNFRITFLALFISIHSLRVEGDLYEPLHSSPLPTYFNPLPPCGGRRKRKSTNGITRNISIHSLRVEGDSKIAQLSA